MKITFLQLLTIFESLLCTTCTECAREINLIHDERGKDYVQSEHGKKFYRHVKCPPRRIFYT